MEEEIKKDEVQEEDQVSEKPMDKMTVKELREIAKDIPGISGVHAMKKDELLAVIKEDRGIKDKKPVKKVEKKADKVTLSVKDLKKKIALLREKKELARKAKDRKGLNVLRRRMNRMKKLTRRVAHA
jgi:hypothetical protein